VQEGKKSDKVMKSKGIRALETLLDFINRQAKDEIQKRFHA
jgi:hypothetical protein